MSRHLQAPAQIEGLLEGVLSFLSILRSFQLRVLELYFEGLYKPFLLVLEIDHKTFKDLDVVRSIQ